MKDGGYWAPGPASTPPPQTFELEVQLPVSNVKEISSSLKVRCNQKAMLTTVVLSGC